MNRKQRRAAQSQAQKSTSSGSLGFSENKNPQKAFERLVQQAMDAHRQGNIALASTLYAQALELNPNNPELLNLLSILTFQQGKPQEAIELIQRGITLAPHLADSYNNLGVFLGTVQRNTESLAAFKKAVELNPNHLDGLNNLARQSLALRQFETAKEALLRFLKFRQDGEAYNNLANCYYETGEKEEAHRSYLRAIEKAPTLPDPYSNLSNLYKDWGKAEEGLQMVAKAISLKPDFAAAYNNQGALKLLVKDYEGARESFTKAVELEPTFAIAWSNLSNSLWELRRIPEALTASEKAVSLDPTCAQAFNNLGNIYEGMGHHKDALKFYQKALSLNPSLPEVSYNMGLVYQSLRTFDMALVSLKKALSLKPDYGDALCTMASVYGDLGMDEEAREVFGQAYELSHDPALKLRQALVPLILPPSEESIDQWRQTLCQTMDDFRKAGHKIQDPGRQVCITTFFASYHGRDNKEFFEYISQFYRDVIPSLNFVAPHCQMPSLAPDGRLRIGFVSNFWTEHAVGWVYRDLLLNLPKDKFAITVVAIGIEGDTLTEELKNHVDQVLFVPNHLEDATDYLCQNPQDVLIYTDIGMHPITYFLAHKRLAPLQAVTTGHPDTTGISTIDYYLSAEGLETPQAQEYYSEKLIRLPGMYVSYRRPTPPAGPLTRAQLGLPETGTLYMCPQSLFKIDLSMDRLFKEILEKDPEGLIVLICSERTWIERYKKRLSPLLGETMNRVYILPFRPFGDFMATLMAADVMLDPPAFNGGNTSFQGLSLGVPIVTKEGPWMRTRCGVFLYTYMGVTECIAHSDEDYVKIAVRLGTDKDWRQEIHEKILARSDCLFNNSGEAVQGWTDFFEKAALEMKEKNHA